MSSTVVNGPIDPAAAVAGKPLPASTTLPIVLPRTVPLALTLPSGHGRHLDTQRPVLRRERRQPGRRVDDTRWPDAPRLLQ